MRWRSILKDRQTDTVTERDTVGHRLASRQTNRQGQTYSETFISEECYYGIFRAGISFPLSGSRANVKNATKSWKLSKTI